MGLHQKLLSIYRDAQPRHRSVVVGAFDAAIEPLPAGGSCCTLDIFGTHDNDRSPGGGIDLQRKPPLGNEGPLTHTTSEDRAPADKLSHETACRSFINIFGRADLFDFS